MISDNEKKILEIVRELRAYEVIEIHKDKQGRPDFYLVKREQKVIIDKAI